MCVCVCVWGGGGGGGGSCVTTTLALMHNSPATNYMGVGEWLVLAHSVSTCTSQKGVGLVTHHCAPDSVAAIETATCLPDEAQLMLVGYNLHRPTETQRQDVGRSKEGWGSSQVSSCSSPTRMPL